MPAANGNADWATVLTPALIHFASPNPVSLNTRIVRIDYTPNQKHHIFVRGNLQKDTTRAVEQFPGQGPSRPDKTIAKASSPVTRGRYRRTWSMTSVMAISARGSATAAWAPATTTISVSWSTATAETRNTIHQRAGEQHRRQPKLEQGQAHIAVWRKLATGSSESELGCANLSAAATSNPYWLGGNPPDPATLATAVSDGFHNSYVIAYANLVGTIPSLTNC